MEEMGKETIDFIPKIKNKAAFRKNKEGCLLQDYDRRREHLCKIHTIYRTPKIDESIYCV